MNKAYKTTFIFVFVMILFAAIIQFFKSQLWLTIKDMTIDESAQYFIDKGLYIPVMTILIILIFVVISIICFICKKHSVQNKIS